MSRVPQGLRDKAPQFSASAPAEGPPTATMVCHQSCWEDAAPLSARVLLVMFCALTVAKLNGALG